MTDPSYRPLHEAEWDILEDRNPAAFKHELKYSNTILLKEYINGLIDEALHD